MKFRILLLSIALISSSCIKETTTKIISENPTVTEKDVTQGTSDGTVNGGGGKGVMCTVGGKTTVEVLDLYEARVLYGLTSNYNPRNESEAMKLYSDLIPTHFWNPSMPPIEDFKKEYTLSMQQTIFSSIRYVNSGKKLKLTPDSFEPLIEKNCEMVQIANFYHDSILIVDDLLWNQMNWLNKIALLSHESIYFMDRAYGSTNSIATRKLVGQLFSTSGAIPKSQRIPNDKDKYATCLLFNENNISVGYFFAYNEKITTSAGPVPTELNGVEFVFNYLLNNTNLFRMSTFVPFLKLDQIFQQDYNGGSISVLEIDGYQTRTQALAITYKGNGIGKMSVSDSRTGISIGNLSMSCYKY